MEKNLASVILLLLLSACILSTAPISERIKIEAGMSLEDFAEVNNLKKEEAKVENAGDGAITYWDLDNDTRADVVIIIQPKANFNELRIYDYEKRVMLLAPVGKTSLKILSPPTYQAYAPT